METQRNYGIDLLRIISMIMVILLHITEKGRFTNLPNVVGVEAWILYSFSTVAVNCYVLITGYFMSNKSFSLRRVINVWSEAIFYALSMYIVCISLGKCEFTVSNTIQMIMTFTFKKYWFVNIYILLLFVSPILNTVIRNMTKVQYKLTLMVLVGFWCVLNNGLKFFVPIDSTEGYGIEWFIVLYMTGAYIRKDKNMQFKNKYYIYIYIACCVAIFGAHIVLAQFGQFVSVNMVASYNDILVYAGSVAIFLFFENTDIRNTFLKRSIEYVSPIAFAVYLIHHAPAMRIWIYDVLSVDNYLLNNPFFIFITILIAIMVFIVCGILAKFKLFIFRKLKISYVLNEMSTYIESYVRTRVH